MRSYDFLLVALALLAYPAQSGAGDQAPPADGFRTLDLRPVVNVGWKDDPKGAGPRGWTSQGENDMRNVKPGRQVLLGVPCDLIDASQNGGKAVLALLSKNLRTGAKAATVAVSAKARGIYFLHASAWTGNGKDAMAAYIVRYDDGTQAEIPIRAGEEINSWWEPRHGAQCRAALHVANPHFDNLGLLLFGWTNPHPEKTIKSLAFQSEDQEAIVLVAAATLTDRAIVLPDPKEIVPPEYLQSDEPLIDKSQWFAVPLKKDPFAETCIDQASRLDAPAGKHGFLKNVNGRWAFADGTPCRQMAVQADVPMSKPEAAYFARFLAKYGISMVRIGHLDYGRGYLIDWKQPDSRHFKQEYLDQVDYFISELAKNGIYSRFSIQWNRLLRKGDNIPGFDEAIAHQNKQMQGPPPANQEPLLHSRAITFFQPRVMELNIELEKAILTHRNPYRDNMMYGEDPAICQLEVANEDGVFFWSFDMIAPVYAALLDKQWLGWLQKKYETDAKLTHAWGHELARGESFAGGKIKRLGLFRMTDVTAASKPRRLRDQIEFYASLESGYFNKTREALRAAGVKQPICGSGWIGVQNTFFTDIWANTQGMDYVDRHHYYQANVFGGPTFATKHECALTKPERILKLGAERVIGLPYSISEWNSQHYDLHQEYCLETAPLMSFYGNSLGGWGAPVQLSYWGTGFSAVGFPWPVSIPSVLCQYPALSNMIRRADLKQGPDAFIRHLSDEQVLSGRSQDHALVQLGISGPFEEFATAAKVNANNLAVTYAAAVGRTGILFTGKRQSPDQSMDLNRYISAAKKEIRSATGELYWNFGQGYVTANAPRIQAAVGFYPNQPIELKDCRIHTSNIIASVLVSPLDDAPLATSRHILITAIGRARNVGEYFNRGDAKHDGFRVVTPATKPWTPCLEGVRGTVALAHAGKCAVTALDAYGYKTVDVTARQEDGRWVIPLDGRNKAAYYEVRFE